jgi:hypothetical protein
MPSSSGGLSDPAPSQGLIASASLTPSRDRDDGLAKSLDATTIAVEVSLRIVEGGGRRGHSRL